MIAARLTSVARGRARLRLPAAKGDMGFFKRLAHDLDALEGVKDVKINPTTASVLVYHKGDVAEVMQRAEAQGLFSVASEPPEPHDDPLEALRGRLLGVNASFRQRTRNVADLRSLAFTALVGGSVYQLFRGKFLPAGGTMLMQAMEVLLGVTRQRE